MRRERETIAIVNFYLTNRSWVKTKWRRRGQMRTMTQGDAIISLSLSFFLSLFVSDFIFTFLCFCCIRRCCHCHCHCRRRRVRGYKNARACSRSFSNGLSRWCRPKEMQHVQMPSVFDACTLRHRHRLSETLTHEHLHGIWINLV